MNEPDYNQMYTGRIDEALTIPQGHTYLAQMIAHDIVPTSDADCVDALITTPQLDLSSIYGLLENGFDSALFDEEGYFVRNCEATWDLPRATTREQEALIPDFRNDENLIIAQLHLVWQKLHNVIIRRVWSNTNAERAIRISRTRRWVTQIFQLITVGDLLGKLVPRFVLSRYFQGQPVRITTLNHKELFRLFSKAVFRFGHSMIRKDYRLRPGVIVRSAADIEKLLRRQDLNGQNQYNLPRSIPESLRIEWDNFFGFGDNKNFERAFKIDTSVSLGMKEIPACMKRMQEDPGNQLDPTDIVIANLDRGAPQHIPNGAQTLQRLSSNLSLPGDLVEFQLEHPTDLGNAMFDDHTSNRPIGDAPLWIYVLSEAESNRFNKYGNDMLGPVGSIITTDVVWLAIASSGNSILNKRCYDPAYVAKELEPLGNFLDTRITDLLDAPLTMAKLFEQVPELNND